MGHRKLFAVAAVVALAAMPLSAAGEQEEVEPDEVTLEVLNYGDLATPEGEAWEVIRDDFLQDHPDIVIEDDSFYDEVYHSRATAMLSAGDVPHIMYVWPTPRSDYAFDHDVLVDLREYIDLDQWIDAAVQPQGPDGEVYVIPLTVGINSVVYANPRILEEVGADMPETYEDLAALVGPVEEAGYELVAMANAEPWVMNSTLLGTLVGRYGGPGWVDGAVAGENSFTDEPFVRALEWIERMYDDGVLSEQSIETDYGTALAMFTQGEAAFLIDGHWRSGGFEDPDFAEQVEWLTFPALPGEEYPNSSAGGGAPGYTITTAALGNPAVQEAALTFLEYISGRPGSEVRLDMVGFLPSYEMDLGGVDLITERKAEFTYETVETVLDTPDAFIPPDPNGVLNTGMQELALGITTPEELAERVEEAMAAER